MIEVVTFPEMDTEGQEVSIHSSTLKVKKKLPHLFLIQLLHIGILLIPTTSLRYFTAFLQ